MSCVSKRSNAYADATVETANPPRPRRHQSLGEACRSLGLDAHGMRCPGCPLKVLCMTETRWRVPRTPRPRYLI